VIIYPYYLIPPSSGNIIRDLTYTVGDPYISMTFDDYFSGFVIGTLSYSVKLIDGSSIPSWTSFNPDTRTFSVLTQ